jgi:glycosyltransferase involved in cell wall biosynthesis
VSLKKHILFLCSWYPNKVFPTNGNFIQKHAEAIALLHRVSVLNIQPLEGLKKIEINTFTQKNVFTILIYIPKVKSKLLGSIKKFQLYKQAFKIGVEIAEKENNSIQRIHLNHLFPLGTLLLFQKVPFVVSEHYSGFLTPEKLSPEKIKLAKRIFKKSTAIFPVSEVLQAGILRLGVSKSNTHIIGNIIDNELFNYSSPTPKIKHQFVHISNGEEGAKNIRGILEAVHLLSKQRNDFTLRIVCDGDIKTSHERSRELGLLNSFVFFDDSKNHTEIASLLKESIALVMFSNYETFGVVIAESLACGTPVIATRIPATEALVKENFGILVEPNDTLSLSYAINTMIGKYSSYPAQEMADFIALNFNPLHIAQQFDAHY